MSYKIGRGLKREFRTIRGLSEIIEEFREKVCK